MAMHFTQKTVMVSDLHFPECPRWWDGRLWFVDGPTIRYVGTDGAVVLHAQIDCPLLIGLTPYGDGGYLVGDSFGRKIWAVDKDGAKELFADLAAETPFTINELMMLADGSVVVSDVGFDALGGAAPEAARLICVTPDKAISRTGSPMLFANGMVAAAGGHELYVAETFGARIWHYQLAQSGGLDQGRVLAQDCTGIDGLAAAPDGTFWYANHIDGSVVQVDKSGTARSRLATGFNHATSCVLNDEGTQLFITAARAMPFPGVDLTDNGAIIRMTAE